MVALINSQIMRTIPLLITIFSLSFPAYAQYNGGTGEPNDPYQIATAEQLISIGSDPNLLDMHFILTADIDLDPNLLFDGPVIDSFSGIFDGNDHTISNLTIIGKGFLGLFGELETDACVKDLGIVDVNIVGTGDHIGGLVAYNYGSITSCYSTGAVSGHNYIGGLVGDNDGSITSCYSTGAVSGRNYIGGLVGKNDGSITSCYSTGAVSGYFDIGGLVGWNWTGSITSCYSTGAVSGHNYIGGLVGKNYSGSITSCYSTGPVSGHNYMGWNDFGGLVGKNEYYGIITSSYWDTDTSGLTESSGDGTGLTTAKMKTATTFLQAGWDFVDEIANGTSNFWQIQDGAYPSLAVLSGIIPVELNGAGTLNDPYILMDANELGAVWYRPLAHYRLATDIDLSGITWGMAVVPWFGGSFDGDGYVISNLHIEGADHLGLFGRCFEEAVVSNLGLETVDINGTDNLVGGLVAYNYGSITSCYSTGPVSGRNNIGGLVGDNGGHITSCYSTGAVSGDFFIGGLVGRNHTNHGSITSCYSTGAVSGDSFIGGLVGTNGGSITSCYSTGAVSSFYTEYILGTWFIGGLVGDNYGSITSCYSTGAVIGTDWIGGLVGYNEGFITSSYSTGSVSGDTGVGGLVGYNDDGSTTSSCWDMETSGQTVSAGGTGRTTTEMQTASTFLEAGWDFVDETVNGPNDIWKISEGLDYPRLSWEKYGGGRGEPNNPYLIYTAEHLNELGAERDDYNKHFKLMADIDLSGYLYERAVISPDMIDSDLQHQGRPFTGVLDGNGHAISNLTIEGHSFLGLFGYLDYVAIVSNLSIEAADVNGVSDFVGSIAGFSYGTIIGCRCSGEVSGNDNVGGLLGSNNIGAKITNCYSTVTVNGNEKVGGLVGYTKGSVMMCYSTGMVISEGQNTGGLVGERNPGYGIVNDCFWDTQTSGRTTSAGAAGKTTAEMQTENTFTDAGWDFVDEATNGTEDIWWILEEQGYPRLWWEAE